MRGETSRYPEHWSGIGISIHSPHARGDRTRAKMVRLFHHFNPLPSCEGRLNSFRRSPQGSDFNPLPSCEGRRKRCKVSCRRLKFQSTPLMRGETFHNHPVNVEQFISIHSPHARGDVTGIFVTGGFFDFNPLPSCEGRRQQLIIVKSPFYFNPLPSCEGRLTAIISLLVSRDFNPLPSCEGRLLSKCLRHSTATFQSTPLMRGETAGFYIFPL